MKYYSLGGVEMVTNVLASRFLDNGCRVSIVSFIEPSNEILCRKDSRIIYYLLSGFNTSKKNIDQLRNILIEEKIDIVINQWGLPYVPIYVLKKASKGLSLKIFSVHHNSPKTNGRLKDIEIAMSETNNKFCALILCMKKVLTYYVTSYSMWYVYQKSDKYILLSDSYIREFLSFTRVKKATKLVVITNPITIPYIEEYEKILSYKRKEIIYVGRIDYNQKRVYRVIEVWKLLEKKYPDWKLIIIGDGEEKSKLEEQSFQLGLKRIVFEGFKNPLEYYKYASLLILTSEYEGFPLVIPEGMAWGVVPCVYGSYSAVYDIVKDDVNGIIIEPQKDEFDAENMAERMSLLMCDNVRLKLMAKAAKQMSNQYSLDVVSDSWYKLFV
ncbi:MULTISPECIES: glycosyltransferase [Bacteroides]|jgi:glycosyltransferase|nr:MULTISPECIES: glycosyltransferase [Bacteroides]MCS2869267.1 glycosyltransferase [Bacteroides xylanisolvens]